MLTSNRDDAYDLLQDTTIKALDNEDKYAEGTNFKGWVFTIMRNIFINNYRRTVRNATVVDTTDNLYLLNLGQECGAESPEESYGAQEITKAINEFPEEYRIPFSMHVAGYKVQRNSRAHGPASRNYQEPNIHRPQEAPGAFSQTTDNLILLHTHLLVLHNAI